MVCCGEKWGISLFMLGNYEHRIDQKGRVAIPAKFRKEFMDGVVLTSGIDKCVIVYPISEWQKLSDKYDHSPFSSSKKRQRMHFIFGNACDVELDKQGRIALPVWLRKHARITDTVMVVGTNRCLELWSNEDWEQEQLRNAEAAWQLAEESDED